MPKRPERPPATRNLFALFMASLGLGMGILASAEAIGTAELGHEIAAQDQWNTDNTARDLARQAALVARTPSGYTSNGRPVLQQPSLILERHPSKSTESLRQEYHKKRQEGERYGLLGGMACFLTIRSAQAGRMQRQRHAALEASLAETAVAPHRPDGATAQTTVTITYQKAANLAPEKTSDPGN